ncbi:siderophore-interacting protein [Palleronia sp.]|uniref:siderophore-interacting protein n=1 Tax=Palleronia sp. TaxID=1940284 RepID=UPI0035C8472C
MQSHTEGQLVTDRAGDILHEIVSLCQSYDLPVVDDRPARIKISYGIGTIQLAPVANGISIDIGAGSESNGFMLREFVATQVEAFDAALVDGLHWADTPLAGNLPPNFRVGQVVSVTEEGALFQRLVLRAPDLAPFARDGLHLRLALPQPSRAPVWPRVDDKGRTRWPADEDALHVAVYTIRDVNPATGEMVIDAFRHGGSGPTCTWLHHARPRDPIGLIGPGGGWLPEARHLTLAGDETAFPAIFRILESASAATGGTVLLEAEDAALIPDVHLPQGFALRRLSREKGESLEAGLRSTDLGPEGDRHVWFAAEKTRATAMRGELRGERGLSKDETHVAAYWSAFS